MPQRPDRTPGRRWRCLSAWWAPPPSNGKLGGCRLPSGAGPGGLDTDQYQQSLDDAGSRGYQTSDHRNSRLTRHAPRTKTGRSTNSIARVPSHTPTRTPDTPAEDTGSQNGPRTLHRECRQRRVTRVTLAVVDACRAEHPVIVDPTSLTDVIVTEQGSSHVTPKMPHEGSWLGTGGFYLGDHLLEVAIRTTPN